MDAVYFTASVPVLLPTRVYPPSVEKLLYFILSHILADARSHSLIHSLTHSLIKKKKKRFRVRTSGTGWTVHASTYTLNYTSLLMLVYTIRCRA